MPPSNHIVRPSAASREPVIERHFANPTIWVLFVSMRQIPVLVGRTPGIRNRCVRRAIRWGSA